MRSPARLFCVLALSLASVSTHARADDAGALAADADADHARRARVVLTVGPRKVTVGELEDQIAAIPTYQDRKSVV